MVHRKVDVVLASVVKECGLGSLGVFAKVVVVDPRDLLCTPSSETRFLDGLLGADLSHLQELNLVSCRCEVGLVECNGVGGIVGLEVEEVVVAVVALAERVEWGHLLR